MTRASHVAALVVSPEPVFPRGWRGRRHGQVELDGAIAVGDERPKHPAAFLLDEPLHLRIAIIGLGLELAAELLLGVHLEDGRVIRAVIFHEERLIVRDEFREQCDQEQGREENEAVIAAPVRFEGAQPSLVERRKLEPATIRRSRFDSVKDVAGSGGYCQLSTSIR